MLSAAFQLVLPCHTQAHAWGHAWSCVAARPVWLLWREYVNAQRNACYQDGLLLSFDYISLGLEKGEFCFKLTNLFPGSSWAYVGSSPYPISFLDLPGFHVLIQSNFFLRLEYTPLWLPSWLLLHMLQSRKTSPATSWPLLCKCLAKEFPLLFYIFHHNLR